MDVSDIAAMATTMAQAQTANAVQMAMLRKAIDIEAAGAMQLLQALPQVAATNPPNLGNYVDTFA